MNRKIIIAAIGFVIAVALGLHFYAEWQMAKFDASLPTPPAAEEQQVIDETADDTARDTVEDTAGGHWHGDEWHAEPHRDAVLDEGMHFADLQNPVGAPATGTELPMTFDEILATPKYVERLRVIRSIARRDPEYGEWAEKRCMLEAEGELLEQEEPYPTPKGGESTEELRKLVEERLRRINKMTPEERQAFAEEIEAYGRKRDAWWERWEAHAAEQPLPSVEGGQQ